MHSLLNQVFSLTFESIRREIIEQSWTVPVAVLTGSLVIIPTSAKEHLERLIPNSRLSYDVIGQLSQEDYLRSVFLVPIMIWLQPLLSFSKMGISK